MDLIDAIILAASWIIYFVIHSILADENIKQRLIARYHLDLQHYRLLYVVIATLLALIPLWLTFSQSGELLWSWYGPMAVVMNIIALLGIGGFILSMRYYDGLAFLGFKPFQTKNAEQPLILSPLHRYVRHPWYFFSLLIIWSRDMSLAWFITCTAITAYLIIGSRLEENKLILYFGEQYRRYQKKVPGLFPLPWKYLSQAEAEELAEGGE